MPLPTDEKTIASFITPSLTYPLPSSFIEESRKKILEILWKTLPHPLFFEDQKNVLSWLLESVPLIQWTHFETLPDCFSVFLICRPVGHISIEEIFLNHLTQWLSPEKKISLLSSSHYFFHLEGLPNSEFFVGEARFLIKDQGLHYAIQSNLPSWSQELRFLLKNPAYASDFLASKISTYPHHSLPLFRLFVDLIQKYPNYIDKNVFGDFSCFFALTNSNFRSQRSVRSLARLMISHYLIRNQLLRKVRITPDKRHLFLRFLSSQLSFPFGSKTVLGIAIVMHLPAKNEHLDEQHILLAIQELFPNIQILKGSCYLFQTYQNTIQSLYLEIEKLDGTRFSFKERRQLLKHLRNHLKERVETLVPTIFMNRNEEEIMKNILVLSREVESEMEMPQVIIALEKQTVEDLFFTVTLVRVLKDNDLPLKSLFSKLGKEAQFLPDRTQVVGYLQKKYPKEANVFHLRLARSSFLRSDSSTHFYLARKQVVALLERALGEIRDYTGGMILQQGELFLRLKNAFPQASVELLENFFYSITPIEMKVLLPLHFLTSIFQEILQFIESVRLKKETFCSVIAQEKDFAFAIVHSDDPKLREGLDHHLRPENPSHQTYVHFSIPFQESMLLGYICLSDNKEQQEKFALFIRQSIEECKRKIKHLRTLRLNFQDWSYSLDPRLGGDTLSTVLLKTLYEGLTRKGKDGLLSLAVAEKASVSKDLKTYTFKLRECYWSNGNRIVAYDFEYAWKKVLSPHFSTPFAYLFYPIKNAKAVKEGSLPIDEAKISALDESTLSVELETPSSYFLELLLHPLFSPINHRVDQQHPNWCSQDGAKYVCNGPFYLRKADAQWGCYELVKNPCYWDISAIDLDEIILLKANSQTALEMFVKDEIDWIGRPLRPWEASFAQAGSDIESYNSVGIYWYVFNNQTFPFHNKNLRKAIAHAIDRKELADLQYGSGSPSITPLPLTHTQHGSKAVPDRNPELARQYFNQALKELGITDKEFPTITLIHTQAEVRDSIAYLVKTQIETALGIRCQIEGYSWEKLFDKMTKGEYQIGAMGWTAIVDDPLYTLNIFKNRHDKINFAKWENSTFCELLNAADQELDRTKRQQYLADAEALLIEELPVIPISYEVKQYMKKKHIQLPSNPYGGEIDFKWLSITNTQTED